MQNLDKIAEDLFNKIRGRFSDVTIGDAEGNVTDIPTAARFFDFEYTDNDRPLGKVSVNISEDPSNPEKKSLTVIYSKDFISNEDQITQTSWFNFLKELRVFGKKRRLNFDIRDINKSNLDKRDYKFLAANRPGEGTMTESKLYGTSRVSYQNVDNARIVIKHTENVNHELAAGRTQNIGTIYIESAEGERFKYPFKHLGGARAMARHVSEGGKPFDDFGKHIVGLSEELSKLRKFKNYMGRSAVMAESLAGYMDAVHERITTVKKTIEGLQRKSYYTETLESFEAPTEIEVPDDIAENWIDQLTIRQFNEELKDVFPYIYRLVSEVTKAKELGPEDLVAEAGKMKGGADDPCWKGYKMVGHKKKGGREVPNCVPEEIELEQGIERLMGQFAEGHSSEGEATLAKIAAAGDDGYDMIDDGLNGLLGTEAQIMLQDMYNEISVEHRLHPDDDFEKIMDRMMDQIEADYSDSDADMHEGPMDVLKKVGNTVKGAATGVKKFFHKTAQHAVDEYMQSKYPGKEADTPQKKDAALGLYIIDNGILDRAELDKLKPMLANAGGLFQVATDLKIDFNKAGAGKQLLDFLYPKGNTKTDADGNTTSFRMSVPKEAKGKDLDKDGDVDSDDYMKAKDIAIKKAMGKDTDDEVKEQKTPIGEFILSHYDKETGQFPKGETAVLTMVEKDYGEQFIEPAKAFIERINQTFEQFQMKTQPQQMEVDSEFERMRELAGLR